jgi:hypothetical protein
MTAFELLVESETPNDGPFSCRECQLEEDGGFNYKPLQG